VLGFKWQYTVLAPPFSYRMKPQRQSEKEMGQVMKENPKRAQNRKNAPLSHFLYLTSSTDISRSLASLTTQLLTEHTPLNTYLQRFKLVDSSRYPACLTAPETATSGRAGTMPGQGGKKAGWGRVRSGRVLCSDGWSDGGTTAVSGRVHPQTRQVQRDLCGSAVG